MGLLSAANVSHKHSGTATLILRYAAVLDGGEAARFLSSQEKEITGFGFTFSVVLN